MPFRLTYYLWLVLRFHFLDSTVQIGNNDFGPESSLAKPMGFPISQLYHIIVFRSFQATFYAQVTMFVLQSLQNFVDSLLAGKGVDVSAVFLWRTCVLVFNILALVIQTLFFASLHIYRFRLYRSSSFLEFLLSANFWTISAVIHGLCSIWFHFWGFVGRFWKFCWCWKIDCIYASHSENLPEFGLTAVIATVPVSSLRFVSILDVGLSW